MKFKSHIKGFIFLIISIFCLNTNSYGQTMTLSSPPSGFNAVDGLTVALGISGETAGTISNVQLIFTYVSGYYKSRIGRKDSVTMVSRLLSQTFNFNPSKITSSALFASNSGNLPDGVYSVYGQYKRSTGATVRSNIATSVNIDNMALPPSIGIPTDFSVVSSSIAYADTIPELFAVNSKILSFKNTDTGDPITITLTNGIRNTVMTINTKNISTLGISRSANSIPDGNYQMVLSYTDANKHSTTTPNRYITIDSRTIAPVIFLPLDRTKQNKSLNLVANFPEQIKSGTAKIMFKKSGGNTDSLVLANPSKGKNTFNLDLKNLTSSNISSSSSTLLDDGTYDIILKYSDALGNIAASDTINNFVLDNVTQTPTLSAPLNNQFIGTSDSISLQFTLPEKPKTNTVNLNLTNSVNNYAIKMNATNAGTFAFKLAPKSLFTSTGVLSSSSKTIQDGTYNLNVSYQDSLGNSAASSGSQTLIVDTQTQPITISSPTDSTLVSGNINLSFNLPEAANANSVILKFHDCEDITLTLQVSGTGTQTFSIDPQNLTGSTGVLSASQSNLPRGNYTMTIGYQDIYGNSYSYATKTNIIL